MKIINNDYDENSRQYTLTQIVKDFSSIKHHFDEIQQKLQENFLERIYKKIYFRIPFTIKEFLPKPEEKDYKKIYSKLLLLVDDTQGNEGKLWNYKAMCHDIFNPDDDGFMSDNHKLLEYLKHSGEELFFDEEIRSIYHGLFRIKDYAYEISLYKPLILLQKGTIEYYELNILHELIETIYENKNEISYKIPRIAKNFENAKNELRKIIIKNKDNHLLVKFILESDEKTLEHIYDGLPKKEIILNMFASIDDAYKLVNEYCKKSGWPTLSYEKTNL